MAAVKLVLDVGLQGIPGVGKILDAGLGKFLLALMPFARLLVNLHPLTPSHSAPELRSAT